MKTKTVLAIALISLSGIAAILPDTKNSSQELNASDLLEELQLETYKIDADRLSQIIIENDPSYLLIDLRAPKEYEKFSLPGAINIPFDSLFDEDWIGYIDQDLRNNIFYANGSSLASEALMLSRQKGFKNNFALEGGLNGWFEVLLNPEEPSATAEEKAFHLYKRRIAAKQYFTGGSVQTVTVPKTDLLPIPTRKKAKVQGGC